MTSYMPNFITADIEAGKSYVYVSLWEGAWQIEESNNPRLFTKNSDAWVKLMAALEEYRKTIQ